MFLSLGATALLAVLWTRNQGTPVVLLVQPLSGTSASGLYKTCASSGSGIGKRYLVTGAGEDAHVAKHS